MTTFTSFSPPPNNTFSFQPILDDNSCTAIIWWNVDGQRWYVTVSLPNGTPIFNLPLIGSSGSLPLQAVTWANGIVHCTTQQPHGYRLLDTLMLTIAACLPIAYNGVFSCFVDSPTTFRYSLPENPDGAGLGDGTDTAIQLGAVSYDINIGAGYLITSTFVFREAAQMFEVTP